MQSDDVLLVFAQRGLTDGDRADSLAQSFAGYVAERHNLLEPGDYAFFVRVGAHLLSHSVETAWSASSSENAISLPTAPDIGRQQDTDDPEAVIEHICDPAHCSAIHAHDTARWTTCAGVNEQLFHLQSPQNAASGIQSVTESHIPVEPLADVASNHDLIVTPELPLSNNLLNHDATRLSEELEVTIARSRLLRADAREAAQALKRSQKAHALVMERLICGQNACAERLRLSQGA